jgi:ATP synthase protein I
MLSNMTQGSAPKDSAPRDGAPRDGAPRDRVPKYSALKVSLPKSQGDAGQEPPVPQESDGWRMLSYLLGGMILYGGIGWLVGRWTGVGVLFPIGMILGVALAVLLIIFRFTRS